MYIHGVMELGVLRGVSLFQRFHCTSTTVPDSAVFASANLQQALERGASHIHKLPVKGNGAMATPLLHALSKDVFVTPTRDVGICREGGRVFVIHVLL